MAGKRAEFLRLYEQFKQQKSSGYLKLYFNEGGEVRLESKIIH